MKIRRIDYGGWENCIEIGNGIIDLVVPVDVGPRIIRCGFVGKQNMFYENKDEMVNYGGAGYRLYGGHRLWHSPEDKNRTNIPDNCSVAVVENQDSVVFIQNTEDFSLVKKEIEISVANDKASVQIKHRITNKGAWAVKLSPWAITMMSAGGLAVIPVNKSDTELLPNMSIALWAYSELNDSRVRWGKKHITIRHDERINNPFKFGINNQSGWVAYFNNGFVFIKKYRHNESGNYTDFGSSSEIYLDNRFIELETLGEYNTVGVNEYTEYVEQWELYEGVKVPDNEQEAEDIIRKYTLGKC